MNKTFMGVLKTFSYLNSKYLYVVAAIMTIPCIADASEAGSQLKEGVGKTIGVIMLFAFIIGVAFAVLGGVKFAKGEKESGKIMLIGGSLTAAAVVIAKVLFSAFGMGDAAQDASFDF